MTSSAVTFKKHILWLVSASNQKKKKVNISSQYTLSKTENEKYHVLPQKFGGIKSKAQPRQKAAQTPDCARANTMSRAATISIIFDLFLRNGRTMEQWPFGSCVSYSSCV